MGTYSDPRDSSPRIRLPASGLAPAAARRFLRVVFTERSAPAVPGGPAIGNGLIDDAVLLVSEVTTAVATRHAGEDEGGRGRPVPGAEVEVACRLVTVSDTPGPPPGGHARIVVEVATHQLPDAADTPSDYSAQLLGALAESWGVTYRHGEQTVWFRLAAPPTAGAGANGPRATPAAEAAREAAPGPAVVPDAVPEHAAVPLAEPGGRDAAADPAGETFLAEVSELLAGQLDEDMVTALTGQLLVPRLADWCGVWLTTTGGGMRLSRVWHRDEQRIRPLRSALENDRPRRPSH